MSARPRGGRSYVSASSPRPSNDIEAAGGESSVVEPHNNKIPTYTSRPVNDVASSGTDVSRRDEAVLSSVSPRSSSLNHIVKSSVDQLGEVTSPRSHRKLELNELSGVKQKREPIDRLDGASATLSPLVGVGSETRMAQMNQESSRSRQETTTMAPVRSHAGFNRGRGKGRGPPVTVETEPGQEAVAALTVSELETLTTDDDDINDSKPLHAALRDSSATGTSTLDGAVVGNSLRQEGGTQSAAAVLRSPRSPRRFVRAPVATPSLSVDQQNTDAVVQIPVHGSQEAYLQTSSSNEPPVATANTIATPVSSTATEITGAVGPSPAINDAVESNNKQPNAVMGDTAQKVALKIAISNHEKVDGTDTAEVVVMKQGESNFGNGRKKSVRIKTGEASISSPGELLSVPTFTAAPSAVSAAVEHEKQQPVEGGRGGTAAESVSVTHVQQPVPKQSVAVLSDHPAQHTTGTDTVQSEAAADKQRIKPAAAATADSGASPAADAKHQLSDEQGKTPSVIPVVGVTETAVAATSSTANSEVAATAPEQLLPNTSGNHAFNGKNKASVVSANDEEVAAAAKNTPPSNAIITIVSEGPDPSASTAAEEVAVVQSISEKEAHSNRPSEVVAAATMAVSVQSTAHHAHQTNNGSQQSAAPSTGHDPAAREKDGEVVAVGEAAALPGAAADGREKGVKKEKKGREEVVEAETKNKETKEVGESKDGKGRVLEGEENNKGEVEGQEQRGHGALPAETFTSEESKKTSESKAENDKEGTSASSVTPSAPSHADALAALKRELEEATGGDDDDDEADGGGASRAFTGDAGRNDDMYGGAFDSAWMEGFKGKSLALAAEVLITRAMLKRDDVNGPAAWRGVIDAPTTADLSTATDDYNDGGSDGGGTSKADPFAILFQKVDNKQLDKKMSVRELRQKWELANGPIKDEILAALCIRFGPPYAKIEAQLSSLPPSNSSSSAAAVTTGTVNKNNRSARHVWSEYHMRNVSDVCHGGTEIDIRSLGIFLGKSEALMDVVEVQISRGVHVFENDFDAIASRDVLSSVLSQIGMPAVFTWQLAPIIASALVHSQKPSDDGQVTLGELAVYCISRAIRVNEDGISPIAGIYSLLHPLRKAWQGALNEATEAMENAIDSRDLDLDGITPPICKHPLTFLNVLPKVTEGVVSGKEFLSLLTARFPSIPFLVVRSVVLCFSDLDGHMSYFTGSTQTPGVAQTRDIEKFFLPAGGLTFTVKSAVGNFNIRGERLRPMDTLAAVYKIISNQLFAGLRKIRFMDLNLRIPSDAKLYVDSNYKAPVYHSKRELAINVLDSECTVYAYSPYVAEIIEQDKLMNAANNLNHHRGPQTNNTTPPKRAVSAPRAGSASRKISTGGRRELQTRTTDNGPQPASRRELTLPIAPIGTRDTGSSQYPHIAPPSAPTATTADRRGISTAPATSLPSKSARESIAHSAQSSTAMSPRGSAAAPPPRYSGYSSSSSIPSGAPPPGYGNGYDSEPTTARSRSHTMRSKPPMKGLSGEQRVRVTLNRLLSEGPPVYLPAPAPFPHPEHTAHLWGIPVMVKYLREEMEMSEQFEDAFLRSEILGSRFIILDENRVPPVDNASSLHIAKLLTHAKQLRTAVLERAFIERPLQPDYWDSYHIAAWLQVKHDCSESALCVLQKLLTGDHIRSLTDDQLIFFLGGAESVEAKKSLKILKKVFGLRRKSSTIAAATAAAIAATRVDGAASTTLLSSEKAGEEGAGSRDKKCNSNSDNPQDATDAAIEKAKEERKNRPKSSSSAATTTAIKRRRAKGRHSNHEVDGDDDNDGAATTAAAAAATDAEAKESRADYVEADPASDVEEAGEEKNDAELIDEDDKANHSDSNISSSSDRKKKEQTSASSRKGSVDSSSSSDAAACGLKKTFDDDVASDEELVIVLDEKYRYKKTSSFSEKENAGDDDEEPQVSSSNNEEDHSDKKAESKEQLVGDKPKQKKSSSTGSSSRPSSKSKLKSKKERSSGSSKTHEEQLNDSLSEDHDGDRAIRDDENLDDDDEGKEGEVKTKNNTKNKAKGKRQKQRDEAIERERRLFEEKIASLQSVVDGHSQSVAELKHLANSLRRENAEIQREAARDREVLKSSRDVAAAALQRVTEKYVEDVATAKEVITLQQTQQQRQQQRQTATTAAGAVAAKAVLPVPDAIVSTRNSTSSSSSTAHALVKEDATKERSEKMSGGGTASASDHEGTKKLTIEEEVPKPVSLSSKSTDVNAAAASAPAPKAVSASLTLAVSTVPVPVSAPQKKKAAPSPRPDAPLPAGPTSADVAAVLKDALPSSDQMNSGLELTRGVSDEIAAWGRVLKIYQLPLFTPSAAVTLTGVGTEGSAKKKSGAGILGILGASDEAMDQQQYEWHNGEGYCRSDSLALVRVVAMRWTRLGLKMLDHLRRLRYVRRPPVVSLEEEKKRLQEAAVAAAVAAAESGRRKDYDEVDVLSDEDFLLQGKDWITLQALRGLHKCAEQICFQWRDTKKSSLGSRSGSGSGQSKSAAASVYATTTTTTSVSRSLVVGGGGDTDDDDEDGHGDDDFELNQTDAVDGRSKQTQTTTPVLLTNKKRPAKTKEEEHSSYVPSEFEIAVAMVFALGLVRRLLQKNTKKYSEDPDPDSILGGANAFSGGLMPGEWSSSESRLSPSEQAQLMHLFNQIQYGDMPIRELARADVRQLMERSLNMPAVKLSWDKFDAVCQLFDPEKKGFIKPESVFTAFRGLTPLAHALPYQNITFSSASAALGRSRSPSARRSQSPTSTAQRFITSTTAASAAAASTGREGVSGVVRSERSTGNTGRWSLSTTGTVSAGAGNNFSAASGSSSASIITAIQTISNAQFLFAQTGCQFLLTIAASELARRAATAGRKGAVHALIDLVCAKASDLPSLRQYMEIEARKSASLTSSSYEDHDEKDKENANNNSALRNAAASSRPLPASSAVRDTQVIVDILYELVAPYFSSLDDQVASEVLLSSSAVALSSSGSGTGNELLSVGFGSYTAFSATDVKRLIARSRPRDTTTITGKGRVGKAPAGATTNDPVSFAIAREIKKYLASACDSLALSLRVYEKPAPAAGNYQSGESAGTSTSTAAWTSLHSLSAILILVANFRRSCLAEYLVVIPDQDQWSSAVVAPISMAAASSSTPGTVNSDKKKVLLDHFTTEEVKSTVETIEKEAKELMNRGGDSFGAEMTMQRMAALPVTLLQRHLAEVTGNPLPCDCAAGSGLTKQHPEGLITCQRAVEQIIQLLQLRGKEVQTLKEQQEERAKRAKAPENNDETKKSKKGNGDDDQSKSAFEKSFEGTLSDVRNSLMIQLPDIFDGDKKEKYNEDEGDRAAVEKKAEEGGATSVPLSEGKKTLRVSIKTPSKTSGTTAQMKGTEDEPLLKSSDRVTLSRPQHQQQGEGQHQQEEGISDIPMSLDERKTTLTAHLDLLNRRAAMRRVSVQSLLALWQRIQRERETTGDDDRKLSKRKVDELCREATAIYKDVIETDEPTRESIELREIVEQIRHEVQVSKLQLKTSSAAMRSTKHSPSINIAGGSASRTVRELMKSVAIDKEINDATSITTSNSMRAFKRPASAGSSDSTGYKVPTSTALTIGSEEDVAALELLLGEADTLEGSLQKSRKDATKLVQKILETLER